MRPPPFDRELADNLRRLGDQVPAPLRLEHIAERRERGRRERPTDEELRRGGAFTVEERDVPDSHARLLICRPTGRRPPTAALYWVHGGGMVLGHNREGADEFLDWAQRLPLVVVSVEYRLAPETPHPGPVEDCWAGLRWLADNSAELGVPPGRIVVAGASAGGGIAAALTLMARDRAGPPLLGQLLICPMLDDHNDTVSAIQMQGRDLWDRTANNTGWTALLGAARDTGDVSPYAAPARATDLSGLPPTYLDVGSAETFRDEDVDYVVRMWRAGGQAELHVWPGAFHMFDGWVPAARLSRQARAARLRWLQRLLTPPENSAEPS